MQGYVDSAIAQLLHGRGRTQGGQVPQDLCTSAEISLKTSVFIGPGFPTQVKAEGIAHMRQRGIGCC